MARPFSNDHRKNQANVKSGKTSPELHETASLNW
jgi:hypothetical protein